MGLTKTDLFSEKQNEIANIAKVFAHPARVAIIQHLLKTRTCINGDLIQVLGLAQPTISQHLKELKNTGIIHGTIEGVCVNYCINPKRWSEIKIIFQELLESFESPTCAPEC